MFELLTLDYDFRLQCYCALAKCDYQWFLAATGGAERNLEIQREIIKGSKAYQTLRADLKRGCLLPPLVLAVKNVPVPERLSHPPTEGLWAASTGLVLQQLSNTLEAVAAHDVWTLRC